MTGTLRKHPSPDGNAARLAPAPSNTTWGRILSFGPSMSCLRVAYMASISSRLVVRVRCEINWFGLRFKGSGPDPSFLQRQTGVDWLHGATVEKVFCREQAHHGI